jgi:hypothetical protein
MREHYRDEQYDAFGWLKTLGLIVVMFALMIWTGLMAAKAADSPCAQACRAKEAQCRVQTKNSSSCVSQLNACMSGCMAPLMKQPGPPHQPPPPKKN